MTSKPTSGESSSSLKLTVGSGDYTYEVIHDWGRLPDEIRYGNVHGIVEDDDGFIHVHHTVHETSQSRDSTVVFDPDGKFVRSWGADFKGGAHGFHLNKEGGQEYFYFCDIERSIVVKMTPYGEEVLRIGYPEESPAYQVTSDGEKPVYKPTNLAVSPNGDIYVADGYGSSYVIQYDKYGRYVRTFGGPGSEAGKLKCPHGVICDSRGDQPVILVADRSNNRLQEFSLEGEHRRFYYGFDLPCHFHIRGKDMVIPDLAARVTVVDEKNEVVTHLGQGPANYRELRLKARNEFPVGQFVCPHGASFDREGNIFVGEWVEIGRLTKLCQLS